MSEYECVFRSTPTCAFVLGEIEVLTRKAIEQQLEEKNFLSFFFLFFFFAIGSCSLRWVLGRRGS